MIDLECHIEKHDFTKETKPVELIKSLRKNEKLEYVMNNYCIFVTESIVSNPLIYGDKVASFLYQKSDLGLATNYRGIS